MEIWNYITSELHQIDVQCHNMQKFHKEFLSTELLPYHVSFNILVMELLGDRCGRKP